MRILADAASMFCLFLSLIHFFEYFYDLIIVNSHPAPPLRALFQLGYSRYRAL
jgi:hypothetical protein